MRTNKYILLAATLLGLSSCGNKRGDYDASGTFEATEVIVSSEANGKSSEFSDPGYTATDNYGGDLTDKVSVTGAVDTSKPGDYEIKYSVADSSKNESEVKRTMHVPDTTEPQIKLLGDDFM